MAPQTQSIAEIRRRRRASEGPCYMQSRAVRQIAGQPEGVQMFRSLSGGLAYKRSTDAAPSVNRAARTHPAEPAPTTM
jgi:hypothetical protein